jgi:hypothetical protein
MPPLTAHHSAQSTKLLLVGNSGAGKTGALASLAAAGYRLRIIDLDNKLDVLKNFLTDPSSQYYKQNPKCAENVQYVTLTETKKSVAGRIVSAKATVWENMMNLLNNWQEKDENGNVVTDLGGVLTWGEKDVLVIDSLSRASVAALDHHLKLNGALMTERTQNEGRRDIGAAQDKIKNFLMYLADESIKCNVIIICHITKVSESGYGPQNPAVQEKDGKGQHTGGYTEDILGFPATIGRALSPHVPEYFPNVLHAKTTGTRNFIHTKSTGEVATICTAPLKVAPQYPIETGLADYFKAVRGE